MWSETALTRAQRRTKTATAETKGRSQSLSHHSRGERRDRFLLKVNISTNLYPTALAKRAHLPLLVVLSKAETSRRNKAEVRTTTTTSLDLLPRGNRMSSFPLSLAVFCTAPFRCSSLTNRPIRFSYKSARPRRLRFLMYVWFEY